jgi:fibronectin-binding autotransporter adhesin
VAANGSLTLDNGTLITNSAATFTLATAITINSGGATIEDIGAGQLWMNIGGVLNGSGNLTILGTGTLASGTVGNVRITSANSYNGNITLQSGGSLEYGASGVISSNLVTLGNQGEFITNAGAVNPINVNVSGGTNSVISFENGTTGSLQGNVYLGANAVIGVRDWYSYATAAGGTISGTISGPGGLTVTSGTTTGGILTLSNSSNTYTGSTTISGSTVVVSELDVAANPSSIGSAPATASNLVLDNGTLADNGSNNQTTDRLFTVTTGGGTINSSGGTLSFTASGPIVMSGSGARTFTLTGSNTGANTLNPSITDNGGATSLVKAGAGEWVLTGSNTYSGATSINAGTLITGNLPNTSAVNVGAAAAAASLVLNGSGTNPLGTGTITMDTTGNGSTANFQFSGGVTLSNPIYFAARNNTTVGIQSVSGNNTLSGPITLGSGGASYIFESDAGSLSLTSSTTSSIGLNKVLTFQGASGGSVAIPFNGAGGVTVTGSGNWTFSGSNSYTGPTVISGGTLALASTGALSGTSGINISSGAIFDISAKPGFALTSTQILFGSGTINGAYTQTLGTLAPGGVGTVGTLSETGNLNLAGGILAVDLNGNSGSDLLSVTGNLALGGPVTLAATFLNSASVGQQFTLINYSGTLTGSLSNLASTTRGYSLSNTSNSVILTVTTTGAANLNWNSSSSGAWDVTTSYNWFNTGSNMQDIFYQGDAVTFGDTPGLQTAIAINTTVNPASTTINSTNNAYTFNGSGGIGGTGALIKSGSSVLTLDTSNSYTGGTIINGGTIAINSNVSLGALTGPVTIGAGTLEVTTSIASARPFNLSSASSTIQLDPGVTYSISSNISDGATAGTLVKTGTGILALTGTNSYSGGTNISAGAINASGTLGAANSPLLIGLNGTFNISGGTNTNVVTGTGNIYSTGTTISGDESAFAGTFTHNSTTASTSFINSVSTSANAAYVMASTQGSLQGFIAGNGGLTLNIGSLTGVTGSLFRGANGGSAGTTTLSIGALNQNTVFSGNIYDGVNVKLALTKVGSGSLTLGSSNTYSQGTNVSNGTLIFAAAGAYPSGTSLTVASHATVQIAASSGNVSYVPVVSSLTNSGTIDLTNNAMVLQNSSGSLSALFGEVKAGYGTNGAWNGSSPSGAILSSTAAANTTHLTAVGIATGLTSFQGAGGSFAVGTGDVVLKYTYYGDANLDGTVNSADYALIDGGYLSQGGLTGWQNGDFNYDGVINGSDYTLIDNAFNMQGATLSSEIANPSVSVAAQVAGGSSAVPEPASLGLIGIGAIGLLGRRKRRPQVC